MATANNEGKTRDTGFNAPAVVLITLAVVIFVYAFTLFMQGGFLTAQDLEKEAKVYGTEDTVTKDALAEQNALLHEGYRWIDQEKGTVGMPIEDAKQLLVEQEARKEAK
jgi:hypothetical protein